jgi:hypothetical protein
MEISLLAASSPEKAVWLSFGFYLLSVLVPIIPATIIYWLFPEGKAKSAQSSAEGGIGGWKIKAVGAWGAYVTAFLLGFWAINSTIIPAIKSVGGASVWTISSEFKLTDENEKEIDGTVDKLVVEPPMVKPWGKEAKITLFSDTLDPPDEIRVKLEGYGFKTVSLRNLPHEKGKIQLSSPIVLKRLPPLASGPVPTPLPAMAGPPVVTTPH